MTTTVIGTVAVLTVLVLWIALQLYDDGHRK
jgi:hypothetical protein